MTITHEAPTQTTDVQVRLDPSGNPLAIRHDGRIWLVDPATDSQHWYGRDAWWDTRRTAAKGSGDLVSVEYWRVQARIPGTDAALRTFTLRRQPLATQWLLESIDDGN
ncbi:hypothetical protein NG701_05205 [Pseudarthrobacter sp. HLT3-5]|uniref:hypothetical protein n=1 Tax=Pseudarthrobacter cellobiosi TaxID=2953654 RepID=UPI00208EE534|nr:hypothetical protein [Pseudarthrobacter sp. HLT3-5]MCO4273832.1 hypothetical protein [Pseudarthrobacter sp. HLT3-5]